MKLTDDYDDLMKRLKKEGKIKDLDLDPEMVESINNNINKHMEKVQQQYKKNQAISMQSAKETFINT